jgi:hypothetical protein
LKQSIDVNWEILGAEFVNMGDNEQAAFFHGMARELSHWKSDHLKQMQAFYVADKLKPEDKAELDTFLGCLWFKDTP